MGNSFIRYDMTGLNINIIKLLYYKAATIHKFMNYSKI